MSVALVLSPLFSLSLLSFFFLSDCLSLLNSLFLGPSLFLFPHLRFSPSFLGASLSLSLLPSRCLPLPLPAVSPPPSPPYQPINHRSSTSNLDYINQSTCPSTSHRRLSVPRPIRSVCVSASPPAAHPAARPAYQLLGARKEHPFIPSQSSTSPWSSYFS